MPAVGALLSFTNAEPLYAYEAGYPDTSFMQELPVALRSTDPQKRFVLINLPLSIMDREAALQTLEHALADLNGRLAASGNSSRATTIDDVLNYLYHPGIPPPNPAFDTNGDGIVDLRDVVKLINP